MKLRFGVGYNSGGKQKATESGKNTKAYNTWSNMLRRCYNQDNHSVQPTYIDCTVCPEWLDFQNFADWYNSHEFYGEKYQLDKDLLCKGNNYYSPEFCCLVPSELNSLLTDRANDRGEHPQGVNWDKRCRKYQAKISLNGKRKNLGHFDCSQEAYQTYKTAKEAHVKLRATEWRDRIAPEVYQALMAWEL